jgi:hypothetical protein
LVKTIDNSINNVVTSETIPEPVAQAHETNFAFQPLAVNRRAA